MAVTTRGRVMSLPARSHERLSREHEDVIDKTVIDGQMLHTDINVRHRSQGVEHA